MKMIFTDFINKLNNYRETKSISLAAEICEMLIEEMDSNE